MAPLRPAEPSEEEEEEAASPILGTQAEEESTPYLGGLPPELVDQIIGIVLAGSLRDAVALCSVDSNTRALCQARAIPRSTFADLDPFFAPDIITDRVSVIDAVHAVARMRQTRQRALECLREVAHKADAHHSAGSWEPTPTARDTRAMLDLVAAEGRLVLIDPDDRSETLAPDTWDFLILRAPLSNPFGGPRRGPGARIARTIRDMVARFGADVPACAEARALIDSDPNPAGLLLEAFPGSRLDIVGVCFGPAITVPRGLVLVLPRNTSSGTGPSAVSMGLPNLVSE
jgi:hypothetical protein